MPEDWIVCEDCGHTEQVHRGFRCDAYGCDCHRHMKEEVN